MKQTAIIRHLFTSSAFVALTGMLIIVAFLSSQANAASATNFDAGNIISDSVFTNGNSMNISQIQAFLNAKVPVCDTNGTQTSEFGGGTRAQWGTAHGYPPPYTCLKDYTEGGLSAAQIIYNTAQQYQINPQVLIVLLQKEQGLVTDTWPLSTQYKTATGYGCPDTAPCDSQYYGLTNQLGWSGKMFRAIMNASSTWYSPYVVGANTIQWNPSASCGSSTVNIVNRATAALYDYTPYRPNQAALNAGYGTGDSCSSYGNRNFYLYFNDWFGSTTDGIELFQADGGSALYAVYGGQKQGITSPTVQAAWGLNRLPVNVVPQSTIDGMPTRSTSLGLAAVNPFSSGSNPAYLLADNGGTFDSTGSMLSDWGFSPTQASQIGYQLVAYTARLGNLTGNVAASGQGCIYLMDGGTLHCYGSPTIMGQWAGGNPAITSISSTLYGQLTAASGITSGRATSGSNSYIVDNGHLISIPANLIALYPTDSPTPISSALTSIMPTGGTATRLVASPSVPGIFLVDNGKRLGLNSMALLNSYLGSSESSAVTQLSADGLNAIPLGPQITSRFAYFTSTPTTKYYINHGYQTVSPQLSGSATYGTALSDTTKSLLSPAGAACSYNFVSGSAGNTGIFLAEDGYKRLITNGTDYGLLNPTITNECEFPQEDFSAIPTATIPTVSSVVSNGGTTYVLGEGKSRAVDTAAQTAWQLPAATPLSTTVLQNYTADGTLATRFKVGNRYVLVTGGSYYSTMNSAIAGLWGISDSVPTYDSRLLGLLQNKGELSQFAYSTGARGGIYLVDGSSIYGISNLDQLFNAGYVGKSIVGVDDSYIASRLSANNWQGYAAKDATTNQVYILENGTKHLIPSSLSQDWLGSSSTTVTPTTLSSLYLSTLTTSSDVTRSVASPNIPGIFGMVNGQRYGIPNLTIYNQSYAPYTLMSDALVRSLP